MRIKRLEIQGFKSFKDKTVIYFDRPITGIVGPNGSGKSNIVDAFFWVMGEQSYKHIRSSGSDDIIFKGSSKYQPLGLAEATLVMEQEFVDLDTAPMGASIESPTQKKEVSVTRRVYRSGEGEYFINGVPARLKDIQELFLDTGVGAKGYSVIEQGQIDKVVNSKPEDRRLLIEDAAGIAKYKARKKESLRKLEAAQGNLTRLHDVIAEIDRSLSSLERQAQKARRYKEYRAELLEKETTWGRRKNLLLKRQLDRIQNEKVHFEQSLVVLRAELSQCEVELETQRVVQLTDSKIQEQLHGEVELLAADLSHHHSALELSKKRQEDLNRQLAQLAQEKSEIDEELETYQASILVKNVDFQEIDVKVAELTARALEVEKKVHELRDRQDTHKREAELNRRKFVDLTQSTSASYSKIAALKERVQGAEVQLARMQAQEGEIAARLDSLTQESQTLAVRFEEQKEARVQAKTESNAQKETFKNLELSLKSALQERDQALKGFTQNSSRLKSLEELEHAREGMANGPKKVLEWAKANQLAEFSVLSDFIEVEKGYDQAVEAVLGHAFERLYVQDSELAFDALRFLKDNQEGSAAIQIAVPHLDASERASYNPLRKYIQLVHPKGYSDESALPVHRLIECLVASVEVLESVPALGDIKTYQAERISFVTKNGIWFDAHQGVLFGGSAESEQASGILARKRVIQELKDEVRVSEQRLQQAENAVAQLSDEKDQLQGKLRKNEELLNQFEVEVATLEKELAQLARQQSQLRAEHSEILNQKLVYESQSEDARVEILGLEEALVEIATQKADLEGWIKNHENQLAEKDSTLRLVEAEYQELKISEAAEKERKNSLRKELETEQRYLQDRERRLSEVERLLEAFHEDRANYSGGDDEHSESIQRLTRTVAEKRESLSLVRDRLEQANAIVNTRLERIRDLHKVGDDQTSKVSQLAVELEKVQSELQHLLQNMEEKYGIGCLDQVDVTPHQEEMTDPIITMEMSEDAEKALHEEVEQIRERIRRLGEVNTMAVEEYDEMQKRHIHLMNEKNDLESSIQNLNDAIEHINKTSEERFQKAFHAIAERFEKLFPIIFGGGQAKLSLVYPEGSQDILEAGVDILAQPPGKKISNMTLLSGGEKALTAISLIFAIFMVKPSPFCILDEVDAPLDDSNIGKFNALVREMSMKSQFILVTHNKKTMELNDTLYGVTMEEPGVSRMVSIQLQ